MKLTDEEAKIIDAKRRDENHVSLGWNMAFDYVTERILEDKMTMHELLADLASNKRTARP